MRKNIMKFNEHNIPVKSEKNFTEKQVVSMIVDFAMTAMGDEWIPQEDENFKSFLDGYNLLEAFNNEYTL